MAEALYRKYRPQVFEDVVGQEPIERTLKNAIEQDKVSHAYLFCGPRGTGKTTTARLLAKALLCQGGPTPHPDGTCEDCRLIADGVHPDVYELDAASRTGVENVREEIISRVQFAPTRGRSKVYIIDEVHMLSTAAFNALLKTLEEPPSHVVFILCTTDPQKVPETIHSRCQRFDFRRIAPKSMVARLGAVCMAEDVEFEGEALDLIAHRAEGGLRNALTSLEQIIAFENGKVTLAGAERLLGSIDSNDLAEIMAYVGKRDIANCFRWTASYAETGADLAQFVRDMSEHVRNLYVLAIAGDEVELDVSETCRRELASELQWFGPDRAARLLGVLGDLSAELKTTSNPRLAFEIALTRMVRPDSDLTLESLAERVEALESGYSSVAHVLPGRPVGQDAPAASDDGLSGADVDGGVHAEAERGRFDAGAGAAVPHGADGAPFGRVEQPNRAGDSAAASSAGSTGQAFAGGAGHVGQTGRMGQAGSPVLQGGAQVPRGGDAAQAPSAGADVAVPDAAAGAVAEVSDAASAPSGGSRRSALANPAGLQRIWQSVLSSVKKEKQAYGVLFLNTKASYDAATGMVSVLFPEDSTFAFNAVQKAEVQDTMARAFVKTVGEEVPFCYVQGSGARVQGGGRSSANAPAAGAPAVSSRADAHEGGAPSRVDAREDAAAPSRAEAREDAAAPSRAEAREDAAPRVEAREDAAAPRHSALQPDAPTGTAASQAAYEEAPYDAVPYDEVPHDAPPYDEVPYEQVPYEQVPYDEMPYDYVPYDDFDAPPAPSRQPSAAPHAVSPGQEPQWQPAASAGIEADTRTGASPFDNVTPDGSVAEDPAELQELLRAGFGDGVVIREVDE